MTESQRFRSTGAGLGRGLDALFNRTGSRDDAAPDEMSIQLDVPVTRIRPNPEQPRVRFDPDELTVLANSIRTHGLLQPLVVRTDPDRWGCYLLISGERRWRALQQAGLETAAVLIRTADRDEGILLALIENLHREDLSPLEQAAGFKLLADKHGLSHADIAERIGFHRTHVTNTLRLLNLPQPVQKVLETGTISAGHGRALLMVTDEETCIRALQQVLDDDLTVRETENLCRTLTQPAAPPAEESQDIEPREDKEVLAEVRRLERGLQERFGTRVAIKRTPAGRGRLTFSFYSDADLNHLLSLLGGDEF